jgi:hypothetical protein
MRTMTANRTRIHTTGHEFLENLHTEVSALKHWLSSQQPNKHSRSVRSTTVLETHFHWTIFLIACTSCHCTALKRWFLLLDAHSFRLHRCYSTISLQLYHFKLNSDLLSAWRRPDDWWREHAPCPRGITCGWVILFCCPVEPRIVSRPLYIVQYFVLCILRRETFSLVWLVTSDRGLVLSLSLA